MKYFDIDFAITLHDTIIDEIGGLKGYNSQNIGYLISALDQIKKDDFYPDLVHKLAHLIFACVKFHPFLDGNKRTAIYISEHFARLNGVIFDENYFIKMENVIVKLAENSLNKDDLTKFLNQNFFKG